MTSPATTMARKRPKRTRTTNISRRPTLALSTVDPHRMALDHPTTPSLVCPDCDTWCPITDVRGTAMSVLVPHHTEPVGSPDPRRCRGSHRLLDLDLVTFSVALEAWERHLAESTPVHPGCDTRAEHKARARAARRTRTPEPAYRAYTTHRARCATCTDTTWCPTAQPLTGALHLAFTAAAWRRRLDESIPSAGSRRSTKVLPKPVVPAAPAVMHVLPPVPSAEAARKVLEVHVKRCAACTGDTRCIDGTQLAATAARLLRQEPRRKQAREKVARQDAAFEKYQAQMFPGRRAAQWDRVRPAVRRVDADRKQLPAGGAPIEHDVPIEPLGMAYKVRAHLGHEGERLGDERLWQAHRRGGASMALAPGLRLVWHADPAIFAVARSDSRIETTITADTVGQVLAILAHNQA